MKLLLILLVLRACIGMTILWIVLHILMWGPDTKEVLQSSVLIWAALHIVFFVLQWFVKEECSTCGSDAGCICDSWNEGRNAE